MSRFALTVVLWSERQKHAKVYSLYVCLCLIIERRQTEPRETALPQQHLNTTFTDWTIHVGTSSTLPSYAHVGY